MLSNIKSGPFLNKYISRRILRINEENFFNLLNFRFLLLLWNQKKDKFDEIDKVELTSSEWNKRKLMKFEMDTFLKEKSAMMSSLTSFIHDMSIMIDVMTPIHS